MIPHSRPPGLVPPSLCGPDGEHAPLVESTSAEADCRRLNRLSQRPAQTSRGCDSRRPPGLPGEKEGLASLTSARGHGTRGPVRGGRPCRRDAPQLPPHAPVARQGRCTASRCAACDRQERRRGRGTARPGLQYELPETAQTRTARHDTIVCACTSACRGVQRGAGDQDTQPSPRPEPEAGHLAIDKCKTIDGASPCPVRRTAAATRSSRSTETGPRSSAGRTAPSTPSPGGTSKSSMWTLKSSRFGPPCHRVHGREGQRTSNETDPTRSS